MTKTKALFALSLALYATCSFSQISGDEVIRAFYQKGQDDCASIALIKASLNVYGFSAFSLVASGTDYQITLKDGSAFAIDEDKVAKAAKTASFQFPDGVVVTDEMKRIKRQAEVTFAVMAECKHRIDKTDSYESALASLGQGAYTPTVYKYLGLTPGKNVLLLRRFSGVADKCGLVVWRLHHAVFSCNGYMDLYGVKTPLQWRYTGRFQLY